MPKRLLMYQIEHLKSRVRRLAHQKKEVIYAQEQQAMKGLKYPKRLSVREQYEILLQETPKWKKGFTKRTHTGLNFNMEAASGADKKYQAESKAYEAKKQRITGPFRIRRNRVDKGMEQCVDAIILNGVEGFDDVITAFEKETF